MKWLVTLLVVLTAFAGCAESGPEEGTQSTDESADNGGDETVGNTGDGGVDGSEGGSGSPGNPGGETGEPGVGNETGNVTVPNSAPEVQLNASTLSGFAPLPVSFTLNATDVDGDELAWSFDVDGDGTDDVNSTTETLPLVFNHTFANAGDYVAVFNVTDGTNFTVTNVTIDVMVKPTVTEEMSCTATLGAAVISLSFDPIYIGGCSLGSLSNDRIVHEVLPGDNCNIQYSDDGDNQADGTAAAGQYHYAGTSFTAFCSVGAQNAENTIVLAVPE